MHWTHLSNFDMFHQFATQPSITNKFPAAKMRSLDLLVGAWNEATPTILNKRRTMSPNGVEMALRIGPIRVKIGENQTNAAASYPLISISHRGKNHTIAGRAWKMLHHT